MQHCMVMGELFIIQSRLLTTLKKKPFEAFSPFSAMISIHPKFFPKGQTAEVVQVQGTCR